MAAGVTAAVVVGAFVFWGPSGTVFCAHMVNRFFSGRAIQ